MRTVQLSKPVGDLRTINIRLPGVAVVDHITTLVSREGHLPSDAVPRIAARLSGVPMGAISRLPLSDLTAIRHAIEGLYHQQHRRIKSKPSRAI